MFNKVAQPFKGLQFPKIRSIQRRTTNKSSKADQTESAKVLQHLKSQDTWNKYWESSTNQEQGLSFVEHEFSDAVNLSGYKFPKTKGKVYFNHAHFKALAGFQATTFHQKANFQNAVFHQKADFRGAIFTEGADFQGATFMQGADFRDTKFKGGANFKSSTFRQQANFQLAAFTDGGDFKGATFQQQANFQSVTFDQDSSFEAVVFLQKAYFWQVIFQRWANFRGATFADDVYFEEAFFKQWADFWYANFNQHANFQEVNFCEEVTFRGAKFSRQSHLSFSGLDLKKCKILDFSQIQCEGNLDFSNIKTTTVLDLTDSDIHRSIDLSRAQINHKKKQKLPGFSVDHKKTTKAFSFLKALAKKANDPHLVLDFFAKEQRSSYHSGHQNLPKTLIYRVFDILSNYGRSIFRPLVFLFITWLSFSWLYLPYTHRTPNSTELSCQTSIKSYGMLTACGLLDLGQTLSLGSLSQKMPKAMNYCSEYCPTFSHAQDYSSRQTLFFLPSSYAASHSTVLKHEDMPIMFHSLTRVQNLLSLAFLSLFILALRNRFRV